MLWLHGLHAALGEDVAALWHAGHVLAHVVRRHLVLDHEVHLLHVEVLAVAETPCAVALVAVEAEEAVFIACDDCRAAEALDGLVTRVGADHALPCLKLRALLVSVNTFLPHTEPEAFFGSPEPRQVLRQVVDHVEVV